MRQDLSWGLNHLRINTWFSPLDRVLEVFSATDTPHSAEPVHMSVVIVCPLNFNILSVRTQIQQDHSRCACPASPSQTACP